MNRPPKDITPKNFFESWLPGEVSKAGAPGGPSDEIRVRVNLEGADGGTWDLSVRSGALAVRPHTAEPHLTLMQSVVDWRAMAVGEEGAPALTPPAARPTDLVFADPAAQKLLAMLKGTLRFEVTGYAGRTWWMLVHFGPGTPSTQPNATISVDAETYSQMLARKMAPPEAYFAGKIRILGDSNLAMQVGMAMMPRFASA